MPFLPTEADRQTLSEHPKVTAGVRQLMIIIGALSAGVLTFAAIVVMRQQQVNWQPGTIGLVGIVVAASTLPMSLILPRILEAAKIKEISEKIEQEKAAGAEAPADSLAGPLGGLLEVLPSSTIVAGALLEGAAFLNLIAAMVENCTTSLVIAIVLWLVLLTKIPSAAKWTDHLLRVSERLRESARTSF